MAAGQDRCSFTGPNATARLPAYLQSTQALLLIIHCKNAVDLSCGRRRRFPRIPQPVFHSRKLLGCSQGPPKEVWQIRGGHQDGHQLESLHFYGVPWPHRSRQKSSKKEVVKLATFFQKSRLQNPDRSTARIAAFGGVIVIASTGSIANHRSP